MSLLPPANLAAEQHVLAALLANNLAIWRVGALAPEHFADPIHGRIFEAIGSRIAAGGLADAITLRDELAGHLLEVGGVAYLAQLANLADEIADVTALGAAIRAAWMARGTIDDAETAATVSAIARRRAFDGALVDADVVSLADALEAAACRLRGLLVPAAAAAK